MEKSQIIAHINSFIKRNESKTPCSRKEEKKQKKLILQLKSAKEDNLVIGAKPIYYTGYLMCNSTAVGTSSFGNTESRRTVALDYKTEVQIFGEGHDGTCKKGFSLFLIPPGETRIYYKKSEMKTYAKQYGYALHSQNFSDLNILMRDHRLNRFTFCETSQPFELPIRAVFNKQGEDANKELLGYIYEKNGKECCIIEPEIDSYSEKKDGLSWKSLIIITIFCPFIGGFLMLIKFLRQRWYG